MVKLEELTNPKSCMSRAGDHEMTFVLLGRDAAAPAAIRAWIDERVALGKNMTSDEQILEAQHCADYMQQQRRDRIGLEAATESKAEGGQTQIPSLEWEGKTPQERNDIVCGIVERLTRANSPYLTPLEKWALNMYYTQTCEVPPAEPPQPSVQPHDHAKDDRKLPIDRPCSACSAGDSEMEYHSHCPPFRVEPSVQGEQDEPVAELINIWTGKRHEEFACWGVGEMGYKPPMGVTVKSRHPLYLHPSAPSITSERIAEIANERFTTEESIDWCREAIIEALREAGVRVGK